MRASNSPQQRTRLSADAGKQQGAALMIVIFIFALVSILSVGIYNRQALFVQMAGNVLAQSQAYEYAIASEIYGRRLLKADWDEDKKNGKMVDDLAQIQNSLVVPVDDALLEAQFNDVQGKLNINDLVSPAVGTSGSVPNIEMFERFKRLFSSLSIDEVKVEALQDWIDEDKNPTNFEGAEDGEYLAAQPPYRTGEQPMAHVSELVLMLGMTVVEYEKLLPHVTALPVGHAPINVNTATEEVLLSLSPGLNKPLVKQLMQARENKRWETLDEFKSDPALAGLSLNDQYLSVSSNFFEIATQITLGDRVERMVSLVYRKPNDGTMQTILRDQSQKYLITKERVALQSGN